MLHKDLNTLVEWAIENGMKINLGKYKMINFTGAWDKNPPGHSLGDQNIPDASSCKYLGIILRSDLNWVGQVNYIVQETGRHFTL